MKNAKKLVAFIMSAAMVMSVPAFVTGCNDGSDDGTHNSQDGSAVKVKDFSDISLKVDEVKTLTVSEYITANGNAVTVSSAANGSVVTVSEKDGVITVKGKAKGEATVTVKCGEVELSFRVTVSEAASAKPAPVFEDIVNSVDLNEGALEVTLAPKSGGEDFNVAYSLANNLIQGAEIKDGKLKFTPSAKGNFEISVNARCVDKENAQNVYDLNFKVKITVTENVIPVYYTVTIDGVSQQVAEGDKIILPEYTKQIESGKEFKGWKVGEDSALKSAGSSVTVTGDLVITAVIGDVPATAPEKIKDGEDIKFYLSESTATISVAEYINTNGHAVSVSSSDTGIATAGESGGTVTVTAVAAGKTVVTLTCKNIVVTFNVTVKNAAPAFDNVNLNADLYNSATVTHELVPDGADTFTYEYSASGGATVMDGVFSYTATEVGTKTFTVNVIATDGATEEEETATFTVTVTVTDTTAYRIVNGDFETGNYDGWTLTALDGGEFTVDPSWNIVQDTVAYWGGTVPYNATGYHFNGQDNNGITEDLTYKLTSTPFTIGGSGYISFKIGGRAAVVKIYDKTTGLLLAQYSNTQYADHDFGHLELGARQATMTTYFADLSAYKGLEVYFVLEDGLTGGWGHSIMDDVVTYYETTPVVAGKFDKVTNLCEHGGTTNIPWVTAVNEVATNRLRVTKNTPGVIAESGAADLTAYLSGVDGKVAGDGSATVNKQIVKVQEGANVVTEGFTTFNLAAGKVYTVTFKLTSGEYSAEETFTVSAYDEYTVRNFSFETGDLTGWTYTVADGSSMDFGRVVKDDYYWSDPNNKFNKEGKYLFTGIETVSGGNQEEGKGTLKSSTFTLKQNGWISFLLGGAHNASCGLRVREAGSDNILAEFNNDGKGVDGKMDRYKYQFTGMDGDKQCYIEIFDEATGGWGLVVVDDIHTEWGADEPDGAVIASTVTNN